MLELFRHFRHVQMNELFSTAELTSQVLLSGDCHLIPDDMELCEQYFLQECLLLIRNWAYK